MPTLETSVLTRNKTDAIAKSKSRTRLTEDEQKDLAQLVAKEKMKKFFLEAMLIPPLHPEFQIKDSVEVEVADNGSLVRSPYELRSCLS